VCPRCGRQVCVRCAPEAARDIFLCTDCQPLTKAHQRPPEGATCAVHSAAAATFICSRCGTFACSSCVATNRSAEGLCARCEIPTGARASRGARFGAHLIDNFVIFIPIAIAAGVSAAGLRPAHSDFAPIFLAFSVLGMGVGCVVQLAAQIGWGQSLGKRLLSIKVVRASGAPIELWRILLLRNLVVHGLAQLCGLFGLLDALWIFGDEQRCLHDYIADSIVIDVDNQSSREGL